LAFLDGGFQLSDSLGNNFFLKRSDLANAQVLLQALFPQEQGLREVSAFRHFGLKKRTLNDSFLTDHGVHEGEDKAGS
ncbi:hypothetical protein NP569_27465, partial [Vibrio parahaemolyticus]|nr:hypothetical protein [Vibrio parahaemolyticus]